MCPRGPCTPPKWETLSDGLHTDPLPVLRAIVGYCWSYNRSRHGGGHASQSNPRLHRSLQTPGLSSRDLSGRTDQFQGCITPQLGKERHTCRTHISTLPSPVHRGTRVNDCTDARCGRPHRHQSKHRGKTGPAIPRPLHRPFPCRVAPSMNRGRRTSDRPRASRSESRFALRPATPCRRRPALAAFSPARP